MSAEARDTTAPSQTAPAPKGGTTVPEPDALAVRYGRIGISAVAAAAAQLKAKARKEPAARDLPRFMHEADAA